PFIAHPQPAAVPSPDAIGEGERLLRLLPRGQRGQDPGPVAGVQTIAPQLEAPLIRSVAEYVLNARAHESRLAADLVDISDTRQAFHEGPIADLGLAACVVGRRLASHVPHEAGIGPTRSGADGDDRELH